MPENGNGTCVTAFTGKICPEESGGCGKRAVRRLFKNRDGTLFFWGCSACGVMFAQSLVPGCGCGGNEYRKQSYSLQTYDRKAVLAQTTLVA